MKSKKRKNHMFCLLLLAVCSFLSLCGLSQNSLAAASVDLLLLRGKSIETGSKTLIRPENDLTYLGAFRLADETTNGTSWDYGGQGMTFYPKGDPASTDDFPGSLFAISHVYQNYVSEFTIPQPVISSTKDVNDLNQAVTIQAFTDITGDRQTQGLTGTRLADLQYMSAMNGQSADKLYWVLYEYYMPAAEEPSFGWTGVDLANSTSYGLWRVNGENFSSTSKYLFEIPSSWADIHTPGHLLAAGRFRLVNGGSWGPALYAISPWNENNGLPPAPGAAMTSAKMLYYPDSEHNLNHFSAVDTWDDGIWLTTGNRSAVVFVGTKGVREYGDLEYYGAPQQDGCGGKGYHAEPYYPALLFYDPADLAKVVDGTMESYIPQPYVWFNIKDFLYTSGCARNILGGVGFDRQHGILYIIEKGGDGFAESKPIVHAWKVEDRSAEPDTIAPTTPVALKVEMNHADSVCLSWQPAVEAGHLASYMLFRNDEPVSFRPEVQFCDTKVNPEGTYSYTVQAWDSVNNKSGMATPVSCVTPGGIADTVLPIISNIIVTKRSPTEVTIMYQTDEMVKASLIYGLQYSSDTLELTNPQYAREHLFTLTGLVPDRNYSFTPVAQDSSSNVNDSVHRGFRTDRQ
jgi:hypothetical protein